ncbi:hypothetical protein OAO72_06105 [Alphaproteobacteria bacterium]|nr:hypothetical protein [Alphaproteobacteria bacterium]
MGSKGARKKGSFAHDYDNHVMWNTYINVSDTDLEGIAAAGNIRLDQKTKLNLKNEIESYAAMAEAEKAAPPVGGSGRSIDFFNQHIQRLAEIYEDVGGTVSLGRRNPSRKNPYSVANSNFLSFILSVNNMLPTRVRRCFNGGANHGLARAVRRARSSKWR